MAATITTRGLSEAEAASFAIRKMIIHLVPKHLAGQTDGDKPDLSEGVADLTPDLRTFFRERLVGTLGKRAIPVEEDANTSSKVPDQVKSLISQGSRLVAVSQQMANQLYSVQTGVNSEGLIVVATGTVQDGATKRPAALVMKLKKTEGANVEKSKVGNKSLYTPSHLRNLMLTSDTQVFKAAVIRKDPNGNLLGIVSDEQTDLGAKVFREDFLGMRPGRSAARVTKAYYERVEEWIVTNVDDPDKRTRYVAALKLDTTSHHKVLDPKQFIAGYIDPPDRDALANFLTENDVPLAGFQKDLSSLRPKQLTKMSRKTSRGLTIVGEPELFSLVETQVVDGETVTLIRDVMSD